MSDREQLQRMCLLAMITLTIAGAAFALWVHWTEKETEAPEPYTVGEAEMVEPIPQVPVMAATQGVVCMEDAKPLLDPLCEDSYLMPDHPLSLEHQMLLQTCKYINIKNPEFIYVIVQKNSSNIT